MTRVVSCKREVPDVYIGRAWNGPWGNWTASPWANPFKIPADGDRDEVIEKYDAWMRQRLATEPGLWDELMLLEGKTLGCWCAPGPCHGDVLVNLIEQRREEQSEDRHPLAQAEVIANDLFVLLEPYCLRIQVAGSIRRNKSMVKDIELVCEPALTTVATDLFGEATTIIDPLHDLLARLRDEGVLADRLDKNGRAAFGPRTKRLRYRGIGLDVFSVIPPAQFGVILAIRTGSSEFSHRFMTPRRFGGNLPDHMIVRDGVLYRHPEGRVLPMDREERKRLDVATLEAVPTPEEESFFEALGMPWVEPEARV